MDKIIIFILTPPPKQHHHLLSSFLLPPPPQVMDDVICEQPLTIICVKKKQLKTNNSLSLRNKKKSSLIFVFHIWGTIEFWSNFPIHNWKGHSYNSVNPIWHGGFFHWTIIKNRTRLSCFNVKTNCFILKKIISSVRLKFTYLG